MALGKCIMCGNEADGGLVANTQAIRAIRAIKQKLNMAQNNTLVVCPNCIEIHAKKRKNFENKWAKHAIAAAGIVVFFVFVPPVSGAPFNLASLVLAPMLAGVILLLSVTDYVPPLASAASTQGQATPSQAAQPPAYPMPPPASGAISGKEPPRAAKHSSSRKKKR